MDARAEYLHFERITTRWADNDMYGHLNNVVYYALFDTVINRFLIEHGGLDIHHGSVIGVCAESHCVYKQALAYPEPIEAGLRVGKLGRTSVRYDLGIFRTGGDEAAATGWFVHVFVDRATRRPAELPPALRVALERLERP